MIKRSGKKGISPVVATVLLVSIVIVLGVIIYIWATSVVGEAKTKNGENIENVCENVRLSGSYDDGSGMLSISNDGNTPIYGLVLMIDGEPRNYGESINLASGESKEIDVSGYGSPESIRPVLRTDASESYDCNKIEIPVA